MVGDVCAILFQKANLHIQIVISLLILLKATLITNENRNFLSGKPDTLSKSKATIGDKVTSSSVCLFLPWVGILT